MRGDAAQRCIFQHGRLSCSDGVVQCQMQVVLRRRGCRKPQEHQLLQAAVETDGIQIRMR
jgi:hypothetical protein